MFLALFSGGIDSPVAAKLIAQKYKVKLLHFVLHPFYCTGAANAVLSAAKKIDSKMYVVPWGNFLARVAKAEGYQCLLCRAGMYKVGSCIAKKMGFSALVTGESLGQKASQTMKNLVALSSFSSVPIIRPLLCFDKEEIVSLSKRLGLWSERHAGCCRVVPKKPVVAADRERIEKLWKKFELEDYVKKFEKSLKEIDLDREDFSKFL